MNGYIRPRRREVGHMRVPTEFILNFGSVKKRKSAESQMVADLIRVRNWVRTSSR
jgi:hypothetical protein